MRDRQDPPGWSRPSLLVTTAGICDSEPMSHSPSYAVGDTTAGRGRRLPPDERREQIVECAVRLFGQRPYAQVSAAEIAREAGIARGLLNHYFGDKRGLYLEVVRRSVLLPSLESGSRPPRTADAEALDALAVEDRVERAVGWFLDSVEPRAASYFTVLGSEGVAEDRDVARILEEADDLAARRVLEMVGLDADDHVARAAVRAYGGLAKATVREWTRAGALSRAQAHRLLRDALLTIVARTLPAL